MSQALPGSIALGRWRRATPLRDSGRSPPEAHVPFALVLVRWPPSARSGALNPREGLSSFATLGLVRLAPPQPTRRSQLRALSPWMPPHRLRRTFIESHFRTGNNDGSDTARPHKRLRPASSATFGRPAAGLQK